MYLSLLLSPFIFYLIIKQENNIKFNLLLILSISAIVIFHPIIIIVILSYWILLTILQYSNKKDIKFKFPYNLLFCIILTVLWYSNQLRILSDIRLLIDKIIERSSSLNTAQYYVASLGILNAIKVYFLRGFDELLYFISSFIITIFIFKKNHIKSNIKSYIYILFFILFGYIILFLTTEFHTIDRVLNLNPTLFLTFPIFTYGIYKLLNKKYIKLFIILYIITYSLTIYALYPSPLVDYPNTQTTRSEVVGINFMLKNDTIDATSIISPLIRYENIILGETFIRNISIKYIFSNVNNHFDTFYETSGQLLYIPKFDEIAYSDIWSFTNSYNKYDFWKLDNVIKINKIYSNDGIKLYINYN